MSDLHPTAWELSYQPASGDVLLAGESAAQPLTLLEPPAPRQGARLDEPSSLALALVGVVALAAFRGVKKHLAARGEPLRADRDLIKPRRRAA